MKLAIHPQTYPAIFIDTSCGAEFVTTSTKTSDETRDVKGTTYQVHRMEISSASHPFYTGKQVLVDTARRAEKFQARAGKQADAATARKGKKVKKAAIQVKKAAKKAAARKDKDETPNTSAEKQ